MNRTIGARPSSKRDIVLAAVLLAGIGPMAVPSRLFSSNTSADAKAQSPPASVQKSQNANKSPDARPLTSREPDIIIAQHVLLMDGEIVTWPQVCTQLRILRKNGWVRAHFHFTNGVANSHEKGADWQAWHNRIMALYKDVFQPTGVSMGFLSPPAGDRYDAIRTEADLVPDPARARPGLALTPDGKPAIGAQVIVVPPKYTSGVVLEGTKLRDRFDHQWVSTDAAGQFTAYPKGDDYRIVCLHPSGFAMKNGMRAGDELVLHLRPWGTIRFAPAHEAPDESTNLSATPMPGDPDPLLFQIFSIRSEGKPLDIKVPAGTVVVSRSLQMKDGIGIGLPAVAVSVGSEALVPFIVPPITNADRAGARAMYEDLKKARKGR
jgi:hypothetical protein